MWNFISNGTVLGNLPRSYTLMIRSLYKHKVSGDAGRRNINRIKNQYYYMKNVLMIVVLLLSGRIVSAQCNTAAPVTYYLTQTGPNEIYRPNGTAWKGGDTVKITGTSYSVIEFYNVGGDACRDLVIMPQSTVSTPIFRIKGKSHNIKIWGGKQQYGIKINGSLAITKSTNIWADNIEAFGGSIGVYCKQDYDASDPETWQPGYVMSKMRFTNLYIHDVDGEGFYVGHTSPDGKEYNGVNYVPIRLDSVEISNCLVERTQWDGIQVSNARNGLKIFNNTVRDYGMLNLSSQQAGIILGSNTNGDVYNNTVIGGTGNGIELFGYGVIKCYNNTLENCGSDGTANGQQSLYCGDYVTLTENNPKQTLMIYNNFIKNPRPSAAIFVAGYANNSFPSTVTNNKMCISNPPANWATTYVKVYTANSTVTNNTLDCNGTLVILPVKFVSFTAVKNSATSYTVTFEVEEDTNLSRYEVVVKDPETGVERVLKLIIPEGQLTGKKKYTQVINL
ncbi:MAG: hypothetical protein JWQ27_3085 [Ferruginibacter sp.]|nr:hypothetical protein [Ferruginibacter sp.]